MKKTTRNILIATGTAIALIVGGVLLAVPASRMTITTNNYVLDCAGGNMRGVTISASNVTVKNCVMEGWVGTGVHVNGANATIDNVVVLDSVGTIYDASGSTGTYGDKDAMRFFGIGLIVRNSKFTIDTCQDPWHCDVVQNYCPGASDALFINNEFNNFSIYQVGSTYLKGQGFQMECGGHDITITRNVIHAYRGINIGDSRYATNYNMTITNNTFVGQIPRPVASVQEWGVFVGDSSNPVVKNNIFYNLDGEQYKGTMQCSNNMVYRSDGGRIWDPKCSGDVWAINPLFIDPANGDYRIASNSPARGKGFDGSDLGAFPYSSAAVTSTPAKISTATSTPIRTPTSTVTRTFTPTSTITSTSTFTPSATASETQTATSTNTVTPTDVPPILVPTHPSTTATSTASAQDEETPAAELCMKVVWESRLNIRPSASLYNSGSMGYYNPNEIVPIIGTVDVTETIGGDEWKETWAVVNYGQYYAVKIVKPHSTVIYAEVIECE